MRYTGPVITINNDTKMVINFIISDGIVSSKIYNKRDDFKFGIVNYPNIDCDCPRAKSYGVYISQLLRFARVWTKVEDFNNKNVFITDNLQGYHSTNLEFPFPFF